MTKLTLEQMDILQKINKDVRAYLSDDELQDNYNDVCCDLNTNNFNEVITYIINEQGLDLSDYI